MVLSNASRDHFYTRSHVFLYKKSRVFTQEVTCFYKRSHVFLHKKSRVFTQEVTCFYTRSHVFLHKKSRVFTQEVTCFYTRSHVFLHQKSRGFNAPRVATNCYITRRLKSHVTRSNGILELETSLSVASRTQLIIRGVATSRATSEVQ